MRCWLAERVGGAGASFTAGKAKVAHPLSPQQLQESSRRMHMLHSSSSTSSTPAAAAAHIGSAGALEQEGGSSSGAGDQPMGHTASGLSAAEHVHLHNAAYDGNTDLRDSSTPMLLDGAASAGADAVTSLPSALYQSPLHSLTLTTKVCLSALGSRCAVDPCMHAFSPGVASTSMAARTYSARRYK